MNNDIFPEFEDKNRFAYDMMVDRWNSFADKHKVKTVTNTAQAMVTDLVETRDIMKEFIQAFDSVDMDYLKGEYPRVDEAYNSLRLGKYNSGILDWMDSLFQLWEEQMRTGHPLTEEEEEKLLEIRKKSLQFFADVFQFQINNFRKYGSIAKPEQLIQSLVGMFLLVVEYMKGK